MSRTGRAAATRYGAARDQPPEARACGGRLVMVQRVEVAAGRHKRADRSGVERAAARTTFADVCEAPHRDYGPGGRPGCGIRAAAAARRTAIVRHTARRCASGSALQRAISSIVRKQPSHSPVCASMRHTEMHGDGTGVTIKSGAPSGMGSEVMACNRKQGAIVASRVDASLRKCESFYCAARWRRCALLASAARLPRA